MPSESFLRIFMFVLVYACAAAPFFLSGIGLVKIKDGFKKDNNKKIKRGAAYIMLSFALFQFYLVYREKFGQQFPLKLIVNKKIEKSYSENFLVQSTLLGSVSPF